MQAALPALTRIALAFAIWCSLGLPAPAQTDPLPSWNDGAAKKSITDFVTRVTTRGDADFVPPAERIATFDNDGTLWGEQPAYFQLMFAIDRIRALAPMHPEWKAKQPYKAVLEGDMRAFAATGEQGVAELVMATHAGMTTDEFAKVVADWAATAMHPRFKRPYTEVVYKPMRELLDYLRANGFKTYIVSGGSVEFMRVFAERSYGIPPEQVVGSTIVTSFRIEHGRPILMREARSTSSMTRPASPSPSTSSSVAARSSPSAIPTATSRCWNGPWPEMAPALPASSTTPTPTANTPTTGPPPSASSTRRWMKPSRRDGRSST